MTRAAASLILAGLISVSDAGAGDVALIVNPTNPVTDLSSSDLVAIFRQEQQHWKAGGKIYLILQESGTPEKDIVLKRVYGMTDAELKKFWLGKLFRGEISSFPRVTHSNAGTKRLVSQASNALGFVDAATVDAGVKALRIDGKKPGDPGYLLAPR